MHNGRCILDLLAREVAVFVVREELRQDEQRVERRAQLVAHVREELGLVLRDEGELLRLLLRLTRACSTSLFFSSTFLF